MESMLLTLEQERSKIIEVMDTSLETLHEIWKRIGLTDDVCQERLETITGHVQTLFNETIDEEERTERLMQENVQKFMREVEDLCAELSLPPPHFEADVSLIERESKLRASAEQLREEKEARIERYCDLSKLHRRLCERLGMESNYYEEMTRSIGPESLHIIPSAEKLGIMQADVKTKQNLIREREQYVEEARKRARDLIRRMRLSPKTELERQLLSEQAMILSNSTIEDISSYQKQLELKYREFLANIKDAIEKLRQEILKLWDDCCIGEGERLAFPFMNDVNFSEELLDRHEMEANKLRTLYESKKEVFDAIREWKELFDKMVAFEERANDPARFTNRGGALLREEKERKAVERRLPICESSVLQVVGKWESDHDKRFYIYGHLVEDYIATEKLGYDRRKEEEKVAKQTKRQLKGNHESAANFASSGRITPVRRT